MKKQLIKEAFRLQQIAGLRPVNELFDTDNDQYSGKYSDAYSRVKVSEWGDYSAKDPSDKEAVRLAYALTSLFDEHGENGIDAWQSGAIDIEDYMESTAEGLQNGQEEAEQGNGYKFSVGDELEIYGSEEPVVVVGIKANLEDALQDTTNTKAVLSLEKAIRQDFVEDNQKNRPWYLVRFKEGQLDSVIKYWAEDELQNASDSLQEKSNINEAFRLQQLAGIAPINEIGFQNEEVGKQFIRIEKDERGEIEDVGISNVTGDVDMYMKNVYNSYIEEFTDYGDDAEAVKWVAEYSYFYSNQPGIYDMKFTEWDSPQVMIFIATDLPKVQEFLKASNYDSVQSLVDEMSQGNDSLTLSFIDKVK